MKNLPKLLKEVREIFPYLFIIIIYFFLINLDTIRINKKSRMINIIDSDLETSGNIDSNGSDASVTHSGRISIPVLPFVKD